MKGSAKIWANYHFWLILALFVLCTVLHYQELIGVPASFSPNLLLGLSRHAVERVLFLLIVIYATFVFGFVAGLGASVAILAAMLPRALYISPDRPDALLEVALVTGVGIVACLWFRVRDQEKKRYQQTLTQLEATQEQLQSHIRDARDNARRLATLNTISNALCQYLDPRKLMASAVDMVMEVMEAEVMLVYSSREKLDELVLMAYEGISEEAARELDRIKLGEGFNGRVAATGEVMIVADASHDSRLTRPALRKMKIESLVIVPMKSKGDVVGTICVAMRRPRQFLSDEVELLSTMAGQIGSALENAYLYDEARQIADKLYKSERDYRSLFENAHDAIWFHDFDGNILAANKAAEQLTGYDVESLIGMNVASFLSPEAIELAKEIRERLLAGEAFAQPYEQKLITKDGSEAALMLTSSVITLDGRPVGFQHIARDVSEEKRMQDNLRFYLQQITQAQEEERKRIARELHDDTAQALFAVSRHIDNFMRNDATLSVQQITFLKEARHQISSALQEVRQFSQDLRPSIIDDLGLLPAVQWLVKQMKEEHKINTELTVLGMEQRFSPEVELILFRIIQEALRNIYRHAQASRAEVVIDFKETELQMTISDNGIGFQLPKTVSDLSRSGKLGLVGMQERVSLLNGDMTVKAEPGKGTIVVVKAPYKSGIQTLHDPSQSSSR